MANAAGEAKSGPLRLGFDRAVRLLFRGSAISSDGGLPVRLAISPGQMHDARAAEDLLSAIEPGEMLLADKAYDADWIRQTLYAAGAWANIPARSNRKDPACFSPALYRERHLVERFFNKLKHFRRIATRYDKLGSTYLAMIKLAAIRIRLRVYESTA
jgi:transposase